MVLMVLLSVVVGGLSGGWLLNVLWMMDRMFLVRDLFMMSILVMMRLTLPGF